jgi:hypothetical protein
MFDPRYVEGALLPFRRSLLSRCAALLAQVRRCLSGPPIVRADRPLLLCLPYCVFAVQHGRHHVLT